VRRAGRAIATTVAVILAGIAAGFLHQAVGVGGVIALAVVLVAGIALLIRRRTAA
jgi:uncharacterized protein (TIGR03382 family)